MKDTRGFNARQSRYDKKLYESIMNCFVFNTKFGSFSLFVGFRPVRFLKPDRASEDYLCLMSSYSIDYLSPQKMRGKNKA
jgi:hypothetical protein